MAVPVTLITGALGVGKTTAVRALLAGRPAGARWAVVVNEAGAVGIDGALLATDGVAVREVAGGCVCCVTGPLLRVGLVRLLREVRPERVIVEASGLAAPGPVVDLLREPGLGLAVRATVALVDARGLEARLAVDDVARAQLDGAPVWVANRADEATAEDLAAFRARAAATWPPRAVVAETSFGALDPGWIDLVPSRTFVGLAAPHPDGHADGVRSTGRVWAPELCFDRTAAVAWALGLTRDPQVLRVKAVLRTADGWVLIDGRPGALDVQSTQHRADSRAEVLAREEAPLPEPRG